MSDQRIAYTEYMIGSGHPTLADTLNRLALVEHNVDGRGQVYNNWSRRLHHCVPWDRGHAR